MFDIDSRGSDDKIRSFLSRMQVGSVFSSLESFGQRGLDALASATPVNSGLTADSWTYEVVSKGGKYTVIWHNTNVVDGLPVAILIQYGHGTKDGGWVEGQDYINPAIQPVFDRLADEVWREVTSA